MDDGVGEFGCHYTDKICYKYSKKGGTKTAAFWESSEDINILVFLDARVKDT